MGKDLKGKELGTGLYQRKDGRYEAKAIVNGVKIDLYDSKLSMLKEKFSEAKKEAQMGMTYRFKSATLNEWFEFWFDTYKSPALKEQSIIPMKSKFKNTFGRLLGNYKLINIRNIDIQLAMNALEKDGVAVSSIKEALNRMSDCLESAKNNGLIVGNPSFDIVVPWKSEEPFRRFLSPKEQNVFLREAEFTWYYEMFYIMFCTGLRIGEIGGLKWRDIDFKNKCFHINQSLFCNYYDGIKVMKLTTLKTPNSYRTIPFMGGVEEKIKSWKKKQSEAKLRLGNRWRGQGEFSDLVFTTSLGSPVTRYVGEKETKKIVKSINLKETFDAMQESREPVEFETVYPHAIRHTFCSRCFEKGMEPKVVQMLMGHAKYSTTIDIYTHVTGKTIGMESEKFGNSLIEDNEESYLTKAEAI